MEVRMTDKVVAGLLKNQLVDRLAEDFMVFSLADYIAREGYQGQYKVSDLKPAFELAIEGNRVLVTDWPHMMDGRFGNIETPFWHALRGLGNVAFRDILALSEDVEDLNDLPKEAIVKDPLAITIAEKLSSGNSALSIVKHSFKYAFDGDEQRERWLNDAKRLFGEDLPEEELARLTVETETESLPSFFEGMRFPDFFVDIEGTLLIDGQLNQRVLERIYEEEVAGSPITIWTGGDAQKYGRMLWDKGLPWKVVSKHFFRGTIVRRGLDDLPKPELETTYGLEIEEYEGAPR